MKLYPIAFALFAVLGCATKSRSVDVAGMYASETVGLAIGRIQVMAAPVGEDTAFVSFSEDTAMLSPSTKTHDIKVMLTGTNSTDKADTIVRAICAAFVETATNRVTTIKD